MHLGSLGHTWFHLDSPGFIWIHLYLLDPLRTHSHSCGLDWTRLDSSRFTWMHLGSIGLTCRQLDLFGFNVGFIQVHLEPLQFTGTYTWSQSEAGANGRGGHTSYLAQDLTMGIDRPSASTQDTKRSPGWCHCPNIRSLSLSVHLSPSKIPVSSRFSVSLSVPLTLPLCKSLFSFILTLSLSLSLCLSLSLSPSLLGYLLKS